MARESLTLHQAAERLGVHYMTVYRYVRTGRLPARQEGSVWWVNPADLRLVQREVDGSRPRPRRKTRGVAPSGLEDRLAAGDEAGAWAVTEAALAAGASPEAVLLEILAPALRSIGERWARGELSVGVEHRASAVAIRLVSRLGARFARRGRKRGTVVLAAPAGEQHGLPVAITADMLRWRGFEVVELGADTPAGSVAEAVAGAPRLVAVALVCTTPVSLRGARQAIAAVRRVAPDLPVLLGGAGVAGPAQARRAGADFFTGAGADEVLLAVEAIASGDGAD